MAVPVAATKNTATSAGLKPTNAPVRWHWKPGTAACSTAPATASRTRLPFGGQEVDVHALSAPGQRKKCGSTQSTSVTAATTSKGSSHSSSASVAGQTASGGLAGTAGTGTGSTAQGAQGGVLGVTASAGSGGPAGGVLGAIESVGQGTLPFTGFPLWVVVLAAGTLIPVGLARRRQARATV